MVRIKICGITRAEDAFAAEKAGAHALGFIFYKKSKRYIEPGIAASIIKQLNPFIIKVAVFVNEDYNIINQICADIGLTHVQLHGDETPEFAEQINVPVIKALNYSESLGSNIHTWEKYPLLIDSGSSALRGGTGITIPWKNLKPLIQNKKIILAGGLNPDNVNKAIKIIRPYAVDVNSGVEKSPGIKNRDLIEKLINNINKDTK